MKDINISTSENKHIFIAQIHFMKCKIQVSRSF